MTLPTVTPSSVMLPAATGGPAPRALVDYDFQSILVAPPKQRVVLWLLVGLIVVMAIGLAVARVDIVVSANGKIVTSDAEIVIQPFETSVVRALAVRPGEMVKAGQTLVTLDPTFTEADARELTAKLQNLRATHDRLDAELDGQVYDPPDPNVDQRTQRDIFQKRRDEYAARVVAAQRKVLELQADLAAHKTEAYDLAQQIEFSNQSLGIYQALVTRGLTSKVKMIEINEHLVEARTRLDTNIGEQRRLTEQIAGALADQQAFVAEWKRKLSEEIAQTRSDRDGTAARLSKALLRHELSVMTASEDATVLDVAPRPAGSVVREGDTLIRLVPIDAPIVAEIQVDTRDVAHLHVGDPVTLKFEALPWQRFGLAYGVLKTISPDTVEDRSERETGEGVSAPGLKNQVRQNPIHYSARIELTRTQFRNLPEGFILRPGMRLVGDIKIGRRSVLQYVLNPVTRVFDESLHEP